MAVEGKIHLPDNAHSQQPSSSETRQEVQKLQTLVSETETVIYTVSSVFPFQIFPDKLIIDKNKITVVRKQLFFKRIFPVLLEDVQTVKVNRGILFASIEFEVRGFESNPQPITHLWPEHAAKAEQYIMGILKAKRDMVDLAKVPIHHIKSHIKNIGDPGEEVENLF